MLGRGEEGCEEGGVAVYIDGEKSKVICNQTLLSNVICNGVDGKDGQDGKDTNKMTSKSIEVGDDSKCGGRGGVEILIDEVSTEVICNARDGQTPRTEKLAPNHEGCELGGIAIYIGNEISDVICNSRDGVDGQDGGTAPTPVVTPVAAGVDKECEEGGLRITVGEGASAVSEVVCPKNGRAPKTTPLPPGSECTHGGIKIENADGTSELLCALKGERGLLEREVRKQREAQEGSLHPLRVGLASSRDLPPISTTEEYAARAQIITGSIPTKWWKRRTGRSANRRGWIQTT